MKTVMISLLISFQVNISVQAQIDKLIDPRDGKVYKIVQIGNQTWMAQNLAYADTISHLYSPHYDQHKGIFILGPKDYQTNPDANVASIYCYNDNRGNCRRYGMLYSWRAAKNACPVGWHLPSEQEFGALVFTLGGEDNIRAKKALLRGGSSGFEALFGGFLIAMYDNRRNKSYYQGLEGTTYFWSSTQKNKQHAKSLDIGRIDASIVKSYKGNANSVRCIKDSIQ
jgi:uncharacterized protein (TIGR02145 family)